MRCSFVGRLACAAAVVVLSIPMWGLAQGVWREPNRRGDVKWAPCIYGRKGGISGMAPLNAAVGEYLVIQDNKKAKDDHVGVLSYHGGGAAKFVALPWPEGGTTPVDLESVAAVPMLATNSYFALASAGNVYHIQLVGSNRTVKLLKEFDLPDTAEGNNFESLFVQTMGDKVAILWATRGGGGVATTIRWGVLNLQDLTISSVSSTSYTVPWPKGGDVRHMSDMIVTSSNTVYALAARDSGDDGPFVSAIYKAGELKASDKGVVFVKEAEPVKIRELDGHKAEGFVLIPGVHPFFLLATDDENGGSFVTQIAAPHE